MEVSDAAIVERVLAGDGDAYALLVARYRDRYARFASDKGALRSGVRAAKPAIRRENYGSISPESGAIETETVEVTIYLCADATSIDQSMFGIDPISWTPHSP
jgi:hypothetical protein